MSYALYRDVSDVVFSVPGYTVLHVVIWKLTKEKWLLVKQIFISSSGEESARSYTCPEFFPAQKIVMKCSHFYFYTSHKFRSKIHGPYSVYLLCATWRFFTIKAFIAAKHFIILCEQCILMWDLGNLILDTVSSQDFAVVRGIK